MIAIYATIILVTMVATMAVVDHLYPTSSR